MGDSEDDAVEVANEGPETKTEAIAETEPAEAATEDETAETTETADDAVEAEEAEPEPAFNEDVMPGEDADLLTPVEDYLAAGIHIGTQQKIKDMARSIHRIRNDGLYMLDVSQTDSRIRTAADFLANYSPEQVLVTSSCQYGRFLVEKFADAVGARARTSRFIPGTLTNPDHASYTKLDMVVVTDPVGDAQAVEKTITVGVPITAMCDSNNQTSNVDLIIPTNNKGRRALSVIYWLLVNGMLDRRGSDAICTLESFEAEL